MEGNLEFTERIQRCWAHILREARFVAERAKEAIPLKDALYRLYHSITNSHSPPEEKKRVRLYKNSRERLKYWLTKRVLPGFVWKIDNIFIAKLALQN